MISVCIPTYNGSKYIKEQIISILSQLDERDEIIISDDSSSDNTIDILKEFADSRIKIFEGSKSKNVIFNLENALNKATGDFIFLADQDDIWLPNKVNVMLKCLLHNDLVVSDCIVVNEQLLVLYESFYSINTKKFGKLRSLLFKNPYLGCCIAFKHSILENILPFPKDIPMHDIWIGNFASFYFKVSFIDDKLILYRRHGDNVSSTSGKSNHSLFEKFKFRLIIIVNLLKRKFS